MKATCPECAAEFDVLDNVVIGEIVSCPDCGLELEVAEINAGKAILKIVQVEGEDWGE